MNLNQLYYFQTLATYQHYTKASEKLYISQPSLSYAIKELENELGVTLFIKKGRNVFLSDEGKVFLKYVNESLKILDEGILEMRNYKKTQEKKVEIAIIPTIVNTYLIPILKQLNNEYQVQFRTGWTSDIINAIKKGKYDFGICSKEDDSTLTYLPLLSEELVLITTKNHPLSQKDNVTLEDIIKYPLITYHHDLAIAQPIKKLFEDKHLKPHILYELDDETSIASMVSQDFGIGLTANNDNLKPFDNIEIIHLHLKQDLRTIYLVYNSKKELSKAAYQLIDYLFNNHYQL